MSEQKTVALLDGDIFLFQAASVAEIETQWDSWLWTLHADEHEARKLVFDRIARIKEDLGADEVIVCLTDRTNFRKEVMPTYKAHRIGSRKPVCYAGLRSWVQDTYDTRCYPTLEADDVLGILSTSAPEDEFRIIVSADKDMKGIPGYLLNDAHARKAMALDSSLTYFDAVTKVSPAEADYFHLLQTLTGDRTDGYPGCPGLGDVKAAEVLDASPTWAAVVAAYAKAGLSEEVALENARVARILQAGEYNFANGEALLWTPPA